MDALRGLAEVLGDVLRRIDRVLHHPPFNFMLHTAPLREGPLDDFHWHLEIIPKLTNVAGYEWGSGFFINPVPPEDAAAALREGDH
jgi:UDPglucose--hexose-1-phosphate uridylyltransferase